MNIVDVSTNVMERLHGAHGDMDRDQVIAETANDLVSYVHEYLDGYGIRFDGKDFEKYRLIQRIVAGAMICQAEHDEKEWHHTYRFYDMPDVKTLERRMNEERQERA